MSDGVTIEGLSELIRKLNRPDWAERPVGVLLDSWRFSVERAAKANAPVWRNTLRRSLTSDRTGTGLDLEARVGTNLFYAEWVHEGTEPHFPPVDAIRPWAEAKGLDAFAVARGIALHGTEGQPFLGDAATAAEGRLGGWLAECAAAIEAAAGGA